MFAQIGHGFIGCSRLKRILNPNFVILWHSLKLFRAGDSSSRLKVLNCNEIGIQNDNVFSVYHSKSSKVTIFCPTLSIVILSSVSLYNQVVQTERRISFSFFGSNLIFKEFRTRSISFPIFAQIIPFRIHRFY